jgi:hypothetical protein
MSLTNDTFATQVGEVAITVVGTTGAVHATWTLQIDGQEVDQASAAGDFALRGDLPDGTEVRAEIHQSLMGPTRVVVMHGEEEIDTFQGFVA